MTICEIEGSGMINHIWITISPEAPQLNRSDISDEIFQSQPYVEKPEALTILHRNEIF